MKDKAFTYEAIEVGTDCRMEYHRKRVLLRETKKSFIGDNGRRYRKADGYVVGRWPAFALDLSSIRKVEE